MFRSLKLNGKTHLPDCRFLEQSSPKPIGLAQLRQSDSARQNGSQDQGNLPEHQLSDDRLFDH